MDMEEKTNLEEMVLNKMVKTMNLTDVDISSFSYLTPFFPRDRAGDEECLELDSLDALELVVLIHDEWKIDVPEEDMPKLKNVKAVADYIRERI
jgi:hypothetical protein